MSDIDVRLDAVIGDMDVLWLGGDGRGQVGGSLALGQGIYQAFGDGACVIGTDVACDGDVGVAFG